MLTDHVGLHTSSGQGGTRGDKEARGVNSSEEGKVRRTGWEGGDKKCRRFSEQRVRAEGVNCVRCKGKREGLKKHNSLGGR